jgi:rubrerythrin
MTVFTRRGSNKAAPVAESDKPIAKPQVPIPAVDDASVAPVPSAAPIPVPNEPVLEVDENEDAINDLDDTEEPIIPVDATTSRPGISEGKARLLFEKYGLNYPAAKRAAQEHPNKIRRVEKPIRMRLHWSCHQCKTAFAHDKVCSSCGHGRCDDCSRSPPQRVLRILEKTKREKESAELLAQAAAASPEADAVTSSAPTMLAERIPDEIEAESPSDPSPHAAGSKPGTEPLRFIYTIRSNSLQGANGFELYHMSRNYSYDSNTPKPSIQRVFKQPRQRVRWTCDHCDSIFTHRDRCSNCQHEKCVDCIRSPYAHQNFSCNVNHSLIMPRRFKKEKQASDPSVMHAVEARLAGHSAAYQAPLIAA